MNKTTRRNFLAAYAAGAGAFAFGGCATIPRFNARRPPE